MMLQVISRPGHPYGFMFSIIRFVLIVGVIFYYSPVRDRSGESFSLASLLGGPKAPAPPAAVPDASNRLETIWKALPDSAKQAVIDRILAAPGPVATATDTLHADERHPAYVNKPRI
ncbi:MAG TPA: hypothetical protein VEZ16_15295 [Microvirga sp.]|nr:hypothetical protein [Microvirga sp.]